MSFHNNKVINDKDAIQEVGSICCAPAITGAQFIPPSQITSVKKKARQKGQI